jgi:biotin carboxylase
VRSLNDSAMEPHVLLITPADSYRTRDYLDATAALGCRVTIATDATVAMSWSAISLPLADPVTAAESILRRLTVEPDAVLGTDGPAVAVAAAVARTLGLGTNSAASLLAADNKLVQRRALAALGVSQPRFTSSEAVDEWTHFPAVVKPVDRSASQGVLRADDAAELAARISVVGDLVGPDAPVLIEEFVPGLEVAVEGILRGGVLDVLAVFDKPDTPIGPTFPETLLISPSRLDSMTVDSVIDLAAEACAAIGLTEGPVHVECKVQGQRIWFIELAARTIGGLCSRSLRPGGLTLEQLVLGHALGRPAPSYESDGATGVLMLPVPTRGILEGVDGQDLARATPAVSEVIISIGPGEEVVPLPHGNRYLGFVFAQADTADEVEDALRQAWGVLDVRINASTSDNTDQHPPRDRSNPRPE